MFATGSLQRPPAGLGTADVSYSLMQTVAGIIDVAEPQLEPGDAQFSDG
jgi:hypothetical protein